MRSARSLEEIGECIRAVQSQVYNCAMITFRTAKTVKIFASPEMPWTLDGVREDGHAEILVENLHHAISLVRRAEG